MLASRSKPEIWDIWLGAGGHNVDLSTAETAVDDGLFHRVFESFLSTHARD